MKSLSTVNSTSSSRRARWPRLTRIWSNALTGFWQWSKSCRHELSMIRKLQGHRRVMAGWSAGVLVVAALKCWVQFIGGSIPILIKKRFVVGKLFRLRLPTWASLHRYTFATHKERFHPKGLASCRTTLVPINSIILSTRASIGSLAIAETDLYTNQGYKLLVPSGTAQFVANGPEGGIKPGFF